MTGVEEGPAVRVTACARTHRGRVRSDNEDGFLVLDLATDGICLSEDGHAQVDVALGGEGAVLLVADGMGGRAGGARASGIAVQAVRESLSREGRGDGPSPVDFTRGLHDALTAANAEILTTASRETELEGMGSTATLAGILGDSVYVAQVGDSRAYLIRGSSVVRLTRDQSLIQDLVDSGIMDEDDALGVRDNVLLQALGVGAAVRPEVTYHTLCREDVLLLCSDGLSQVVRDAELASIVAEAGGPAGACERLVDLANERGGPDNITVLAARVSGAALGAADQEPVARQIWDMRTR